MFEPGKLLSTGFGTAMGSPVSKVITSLVMEDVEQRGRVNPSFWKRYVNVVIARKNIYAKQNVSLARV